MPRRTPSLIGAHVPAAGGLVRAALPYANRIGAEVLQVFVGNPRGWASSAADPAADAAFREASSEARIPVFVHAPYLVNLASPTAATVEKSVAALAYALSRGEALGAVGVVVHAGSAVAGRHHALALAQVRECVLPLLDGLAPTAPRLLIEATAGGAGALAARIEDLAPYLGALDFHPAVGLCLDTCHLYAAGHDLAVPGGVRRTLNLLVRTVGRDRLGLVHANDSRDPLGSGRDRHASLGVGAIGLDPFAELFVHPAMRGVPLVIETPGDEREQRRDLAQLRRLRDSPH